ncbi:protein-tyrosine phosphatase family protein [Aeoliella sp. SH292]|uniref:protein-tyrosine phosphatase family protein n=1 Tax=Aeoliella sp. SH292 TaxID=3454464 RepID=UPI003F954812
MRPLLDRKLWIGNAHDIRPWTSELQQTISAVVDLSLSDPPAVLPREVTYLRIPIADSADNASSRLRLALQSTAQLLRYDVSTLVCCSAGMSRSPAIACGAIAIVQNVDPDEVVKSLLQGVPHDLSPGLWESVRNAVNSEF